jgi:hypothetical protein
VRPNPGKELRRPVAALTTLPAVFSPYQFL